MKPLSLLLLENETMDVYLVRKTLERSGMEFTMTVAGDRSGFLQALDSGSFHAILANNNLPDIDTIAALQAIRQRNIGIPFILVTGTVSEDEAVRVMKEGAWDYISKDRLQRLPNAIKSAVDKYELETERKKILEEVIAKEAMMNDAERLSHYGSWQSDRVNNISHWSDEKYRILGYEPGEIEPEYNSFMDCIHPDDRAYVQQLHDDAFTRLDRLQYNTRIIAKDGTVKHIHAELFIKRDAHGNVSFVNGFVGDITASKQAEARIVESERKYRHLFENNPIPLWVVDRSDYSFLDVNLAALKHYGYTREEFLNLTAFDIRPAEDHGAFIRNTNARSKGYNDKGVWTHLKKGGTEIQVQITADEVTFEGKDACLILITDVTEKINAEDRLRQSEAQLLASQRIAHIGSWELDLSNPDLQANTLSWTDETFRIFGFEPDEVHVNMALFTSMVHPDDSERVDAAVKRALIAGNEYNIEHAIVCRDGTIRIIHERGETVFDVHGKPLKLAGTAQDITQRKRAEELLQQSEASVRAILDNAETGYVLLDQSLRVLSYNQLVYNFAAEQLHKKLEAGTFAVGYFDESKQEIIRQSLALASSGTTTKYEVSYPQPDGHINWYHASYHPRRDNEKRVVGVIMAIRDITERKVSELQAKKITSDLLQRNKELEQFVYIISHNLRAPVANIAGVSNLLLENNLPEAEKKELMLGLYSSVRKLDEVIIDLNDILQLKNTVNESKEPVKLSDILENVTSVLHQSIEKEYVALSSNFKAADEMIAIKSYLHSIFYNIISNSIKYRRPNVPPRISVKSHIDNDRLFIVFKDNGLGIDMEKKGDQVFGLYKRFHTHTTEGKGLGLFMVKTLVETMGGRISIYSKVNEGTEIHIEFEGMVH